MTLENSSDLQKEIDTTVDSFNFDTLPKLIGVKINTLCVAKSVVDSKLYRGKIISKIVKSNVEVEFIDYGITEKLPLTNVVSLPLVSNSKMSDIDDEKLEKNTEFYLF